MAKVLQGRLDRLEKVERVPELPRIALDFSLTDPPKGKQGIVCEDLSFGYDQRQIFDHAKFCIQNGEKVAITGNNGAGKTTLFHLICNGHPAIRLAPKVKGTFRPRVCYTGSGKNYTGQSYAKQCAG